MIASRKLDNCAAAAAEISANTGRTAVGVEFHAGRWADCDRLIEVVYREFGRCDVLVNNAGMSPLYPDLASVTEEHYDKVQGVNLKGPFRLGVLAGTRMARPRAAASSTSARSARCAPVPTSSSTPAPRPASTR